jgi:hypothetical protein
MFTLGDRILLGIYLVLALCLILVAAQAIVTMRDISVSLRQTQVQHEQIRHATPSLQPWGQVPVGCKPIPHARSAH